MIQQQAFKPDLSDRTPYRKNSWLSTHKSFELDNTQVYYKPATKINPNNAWLRRATKILRHLREDLQRIYPKETMPSTWMIKCLVASIPKPAFNSLGLNQISVGEEQWDKSLLLILQHLAQRTRSAEHAIDSFFELDGATPLFPNQDMFGPQEAHRFTTLAIAYLKQAENTPDLNT